MEKLMRWNGSEWVEVSLVRKEVESGNNTLEFGIFVKETFIYVGYEEEIVTGNY